MALRKRPADSIKVAMLRIDQALCDGKYAPATLQVLDELPFNAPAEAVTALVKH